MKTRRSRYENLMRRRRRQALFITVFLVTLTIFFVPGTQLLAHSETQTISHKMMTKPIVKVAKTSPSKLCALKPKQSEKLDNIAVSNAEGSDEKAPSKSVSTTTVSYQGQNEKVVYLTFDDGPNAVSNDILDLLDQYNAKATFFLIDNNVRTYPEQANRMVKSGHSVGLHSVSHDVKRFYASSQSVISEMDQTRNTVKEVTGLDTLLIRTPYGSAPHMSEEYKQAVDEYGFLMWDWNIDSKDWYYRDYRMVSSTIAQLESRQSTSTTPIVILFHEKRTTYNQLKPLLDYLSKNQYVFKALDEKMIPVQF